MKNGIASTLIVMALALAPFVVMAAAYYSSATSTNIAHARFIQNGGGCHVFVPPQGPIKFTGTCA